MTRNTMLAKYDLKHNAVNEEGIDMICAILADAKHVNSI